MAISIFPSTAAEFVSNNFVIDMNDTSNNTADTGGVKQAGPYVMNFSSGDSSFDVYLIDEDGASVGYSNTTSIVASGLFSTVVVLGVANDEVISFLYQGSVNNADGEGDEPGAAAYLESISPEDMPGFDDTSTVSGGNFGTATVITFESGTEILQAKNIVVNNTNELIVTRPDALNIADSPYTLRAVNTGVPEPTGTNLNILTDVVTAGSDPTFVTTSPLDGADIGSAFSQQIEVTDEGEVTDYLVTAGTITPGLTLNATTGELSGTPTTAGNFTFTITATDDGGNTSSREFEQLAADKAIGGTIIEDGGFRYHEFKSSGDFQTVTDLAIEWLIVGGGGAGGDSNAYSGGGGAGGYLADSGNSGNGLFTVTVGGGGSNSTGSTTTFETFGTAFGGGFGGNNSNGGNGGSGGGGARSSSGGTGTVGQGKNGGGSNTNDGAGGGGGAVNGGGTAGGNSGGSAGNGSDSRSDFANATGNVFDGGFFAGGGSGTGLSGRSGGGDGGGGRGGIVMNASSGTSGAAFSGGGGGGAGANLSRQSGGSGIVIVRYAI